MKYILILGVFLLIMGCTQAPAVELKEVLNTSAEQPEETNGEVQEEENIHEEDTAPNYNFTEGETKEILGRTITVTKIYFTNPEIDLSVEGIAGKLKETKAEEIIDGLKMEIQLWKYNSNEEPYVTLKIEELALGENQYIIQKEEKVKVANKDIVLEESRSDGSILVSVFDTGTIIGETEKIKRGEILEINGITITNLKNYYKLNQYAWIQADES